MSVCHVPEPLTSLQIVLPDEAATLDFAGLLALTVHPGLLIFLQGDLGAGKTTFSRGLLRALGITGRIKSPTYTLLETYDISTSVISINFHETLNHAPVFPLYHFDVYRFADAREWLDAGFDELLGPGSMALVEWPDKAAGCLPVPDVIITLTPEGEGRNVQASAHSDAGLTCLTRLKTLMASRSPTFTSTF